jgi:hypothetical protein
MLLLLKLICKPGKARKDGTSIIYLQYCYSSTERTLLDTQVAIPVHYWNDKKQCISAGIPSDYGDPEILNDHLIRVFRIAEDIVSLAVKRSLPIPWRLSNRPFP